MKIRVAIAALRIGCPLTGNHERTHENRQNQRTIYAAQETVRVFDGAGNGRLKRDKLAVAQGPVAAAAIAGTGRADNGPDRNHQEVKEQNAPDESRVNGAMPHRFRFDCLAN